MPTYAYESPTAHIEPSGDWNNPGNAYDGNAGTYADVEDKYYDVSETYWFTNPLILTLAATIIIDRIRFKWYNNPNHPLWIEVYNATTGQWDEVVKDHVTEFAEAGAAGVVGTTTYAVPNTTTDRVRFRAALCGLEFDLYEVEVRRVIPDIPDPDDPNPDDPIPEPPQVVKQVIKKQITNAPPAYGSRIRTYRRRTKLVPVIIGG